MGRAEAGFTPHPKECNCGECIIERQENRIAELEAALRDIYTRNVGAEGYERHCFTLKDIAGRALGDADEH